MIYIYESMVRWDLRTSTSSAISSSTRDFKASSNDNSRISARHSI